MFQQFERQERRRQVIAQYDTTRAAAEYVRVRMRDPDPMDDSSGFASGSYKTSWPLGPEVTCWMPAVARVSWRSLCSGAVAVIFGSRS